MIQTEEETEDDLHKDQDHCVRAYPLCCVSVGKSLVADAHERHLCSTQSQICVGTREIRSGRKTNEIAKFSILDEKTKFTILDEIWTKNGQLIAEPNAIRD